MTTTRPTILRSLPYIFTDELADLLNEVAGRCLWDSQRVRRLLARTGAGEKVGGRWATTRDRLREHCSDLWAELVPRLEGETDDG